MTHGDHWSAIDSNVEERIDQLVPQILQEGRLGYRARASVALSDGPVRTEEVTEFRHGDGPIRFIAYVATNSSRPGNRHEFVVAFPFCWEGTTRRLTICETVVDPGDVEALVTALVGADGGLLWFFDPHHFACRERYAPESQLDFVLAGLAYVLRPASTAAIEVTGGDMLRLHRERVLEDDPTIDPETITSVSLSLEEAAFMFPRSEQPEVAEFMTTVERVDEFELLGIRFVRIWATFMRLEEGEPLRLPVYASEETLGGYRPKVGDRIEGAMWLQGRPVE